MGSLNTSWKAAWTFPCHEISGFAWSAAETWSFWQCLHASTCGSTCKIWKAQVSTQSHVFLKWASRLNICACKVQKHVGDVANSMQGKLWRMSRCKTWRVNSWCMHAMCFRWGTDRSSVKHWHDNTNVICRMPAPHDSGHDVVSARKNYWGDNSLPQFWGDFCQYLNLRKESAIMWRKKMLDVTDGSICEKN